jgi:hypothetical protein
MGVFLRKDIAEKYKFNEDRNLSADNRISAALIDHANRSVSNFDDSKLLLRRNLAIHYAFTDEKVQEKFGKYKRRIMAYWDSYVALHLALGGNKQLALYWWFQSLKNHLPSLFERRSLAILKYLLIGRR